jgi:hypothetical protein
MRNLRRHWPAYSDARRVTAGNGEALHRTINDLTQHGQRTVASTPALSKAATDGRLQVIPRSSDPSKDLFGPRKRLAAISAKGDPLEMIARVVPFESFRAGRDVYCLSIGAVQVDEAIARAVGIEAALAAAE